MNLFIDSSNNLQTVVKLDDQVFTYDYQSPRDQNILAAIIKSLDAANLTMHDLTSIEVKTGPGSFTGLRIGFAIAQTLSLALNIPINGNPPGTILDPDYQKEPGITMPKNSGS
jgi:tRNA threonylcarbamoyl adenosine modification protein YeaZ